MSRRRSRAATQPAPAAPSRPVRLAATLAAVALVTGACANTMIDQAGGGGLPGSDPSRPVVEQFSGSISVGELPKEPVAADARKPPIRLGLINQENSDLGSFPEVREGAEAAVEFVNRELGGVDGRRLELHSCIANFTPERSQKCAQQLVQRHVVAVLGGLDIMSSASIPVLEANHIPYVGGIPVNFDEMRSRQSFQFGGGSPGAFVAFAWYAATVLHVRSVAVAFADYPPIKAAALDYGVATLRALGVHDVREVSFPVVVSDYAPIVAKANEDHPDAVFVSATDKACVDVMKQSARYDAELFLVGACASPDVLAAAGHDATEGRYFNVEGPVRARDAGNDAAVYGAAMARYRPDAPAASAATVSFRSVMNLWSVLTELGSDHASSASIARAFRSARDHPSFNGHPFTCDGHQVEDLPALCSPQQILVRAHDERLVQVSDWIDVPALLHKVHG